MTFKLDAYFQQNEQSLEYRINLMRISNILIAIISVILIFTIFWFSNKSFFWRNQNSDSLFYLVLVFHYFALTTHYFLSLKLKSDKKNLILLSNSLVNISLITVLGIIICKSYNWNFLQIILLIYSLIFIITLNQRQGNIYNCYLLIITFFSYFKIVRFEYLELEIHHQKGFFSYLIEHDYFKFYEVILMAIGTSLLVFFISYLSNSSRENHIDAKNNKSQAKRLSEINDAIISSISIGLIVISSEGKILSINKRAKSIFNIDSYLLLPSELITLSAALATRLSRWQKMTIYNDGPIEIGNNSYLSQFNYISSKDDLILIQLENVVENLNRVREIRLTSLGKLTASIAHEIKNPLGSIQNAAELLEELEIGNSNKDVERLTNKIVKNTERIGDIIGNILDVFSNKNIRSELLDLENFVRYVINEARINDDLSNIYIAGQLEQIKGYGVYFDPSHLRQVLENLMLNSVKHGDKNDIKIKILATMDIGKRKIYLDIIDNGKGVSINNEDKIFEPFYSSRNSLGLGLYLVREICLANQSKISYIRQDVGACFRISMECYSLKEHN